MSSCKSPCLDDIKARVIWKKMYLFYYLKNNSFISAVNTVWKMRESNQIQKVLMKSKEIASFRKRQS